MDVKAMRFCAVRRYLSGEVQVIEWFRTQHEALDWIKRQPRDDGSYEWCVGEF